MEYLLKVSFLAGPVSLRPALELEPLLQEQAQRIRFTDLKVSWYTTYQQSRESPSLRGQERSRPRFDKKLVVHRVVVTLRSTARS